MDLYGSMDPRDHPRSLEWEATGVKWEGQPLRGRKRVAANLSGFCTVKVLPSCLLIVQFSE